MPAHSRDYSIRQMRELELWMFQEVPEQQLSEMPAQRTRIGVTTWTYCAATGDWECRAQYDLDGPQWDPPPPGLETLNPGERLRCDGPSPRERKRQRQQRAAGLAHSRDYYRHQRQRARRRWWVRIALSKGWHKAYCLADTHMSWRCHCLYCERGRRVQLLRLRDRERDEEAETLCQSTTE
jgi:hypothetical protein